MFFDPDLAVAAPCFRGDVEIWHVFEVEDGFFAETMLAFDDDGPEDLAEGLMDNDSVNRGWDSSALARAYLRQFPFDQAI